MRQKTLLSLSARNVLCTDRETYLSHELFSGEDQLVIDEPAWLLFKQGAVGMDKHRLLMLDRLVTAAGEAGRVIKEARGDGLRTKRKGVAKVLRMKRELKPHSEDSGCLLSKLPVSAWHHHCAKGSKCQSGDAVG